MYTFIMYNKCNKHLTESGLQYYFIITGKYNGMESREETP